MLVCTCVKAWGGSLAVSKYACLGKVSGAVAAQRSRTVSASFVRNGVKWIRSLPAVGGWMVEKKCMAKLN